MRQPGSLLHTFHRFKCNNVEVFFILVPSTDCCLSCEPSDICRDQDNLPYPKLEIYIQSLLASHNLVDLCDAVDGSDVSEEWGNKNLDLNTPDNHEWLRLKNQAIVNDSQNDSKGPLSLLQIAPIHDRRSTWKNVVQGKQSRLKFSQSPEIFATRFRLHKSVETKKEEQN